MTAVIDEALDVLKDTGPEYSGGLSNHGPMAAEALIALRRDDAVIPWVNKYKRKLTPHPESRNPISGNTWRAALGDIRRVGDWIAFFDRELAEAPWPTVLDRWVERLAPGSVGAANHCLIRTGHAVRSLAGGETPQRRHELAEGLGYWAARYLLLPEMSSHNAGALSASQAIHQVMRLPQPQALTGPITDALAQLDGFPAFQGVSGLVNTTGDPSRFISDLTETFAAVYLANAHDFVSTIIFVHCVTGPSAIRLLAPFLSPDTTALALRYGWQAAAALYAAFGSSPGNEPRTAPDESANDLIDRAVATGDEHAIKFTEVCLREYAFNPKPVYQAAARDAIDRLV